MVIKTTLRLCTLGLLAAQASIIAMDSEFYGICPSSDSQKKQIIRGHSYCTHTHASNQLTYTATGLTHIRSNCTNTTTNTSSSHPGTTSTRLGTASSTIPSESEPVRAHIGTHQPALICYSYAPTVPNSSATQKSAPTPGIQKRTYEQESPDKREIENILLMINIID